MILQLKKLFGTVKLIRNAIKSNFIYNGREKTFHGAGSSSFDNNLLEML